MTTLETPLTSQVYLRQAGVHVILENLLGNLLAAQPADPVEFMLNTLEGTVKRPSARERFTKQEIDDRRTLIRSTFVGQKVTKEGELYIASFPLTDSINPIYPEIMDQAADCCTFLMDFEETDCIVSSALRGLGALAHACSFKTNKPYALCNWYPDGLIGDLKISNDPGFNGKGSIFVNAIKPGSKVILLHDIIWRGATICRYLDALKDINVQVLGLVVIGECLSFGGREAIAKKYPSLKVVSVCKFRAEGALTERAKSTDQLVEVPTSLTRPRPVWNPMSQAVLDAKLKRTATSFVGVPICMTPQGYPYSNFCLTDFNPHMDPGLVEDMADCCVQLATDHLRDADIIVSESDRGGGPLTHAVALRSGLPYVMAAWMATGEGGTAAKANVGYSGSGTIHVNGLKPGMKCVVLDDMLSSGGTAEALFKCVERANCTVTCAIFASEKVNAKGVARLAKNFSYVPLVTLCQFISEGDATTPAS